MVPKSSACNVVWEGKVMDRGFTDWKVSQVYIIILHNG